MHSTTSHDLWYFYAKIEKLCDAFLFTGVENELSDMPEDEKRYRRGFRGYYYNYLDEMAMSICASVPTHTSGTIFAVRRTCGEKATCKSICENPSLRKNGMLFYQAYHVM